MDTNLIALYKALGGGWEKLGPPPEATVKGNQTVQLSSACKATPSVALLFSCRFQARIKKTSYWLEVKPLAIANGFCVMALAPRA